MKGLWFAFTALVLVLIGVVYVLYQDIRRINSDLVQISRTTQELFAENNLLRQRVLSIESALKDVKAARKSGAVCDTKIPGGLYQLKTSTAYGPSTESDEYEISHASVLIGSWNVNAGIRWNSYGIPTGLYFDYDGDGKNDTAIAARLAREIPIVGNSLADRLLADSNIQQSLYAVFSCEWRNAEFTSIDDMTNKVGDTSNMLWGLIHEYSSDISEWIDGLTEEQLLPPDFEHYPE